MSGLALSAPYSVASMLAVPVAGSVLLAAMPELLPIGSLCPGKGCDRAIETSREHISLPAPGLRPLDTLHNGYKEGRRVPEVSLGSTGVPEAPGGRGFLYIFSDPWDTGRKQCTVGGKGRMDNKVGKVLGDVWLLGEY